MHVFCAVCDGYLPMQLVLIPACVPGLGILVQGLSHRFSGLPSRLHARWVGREGARELEWKKPNKASLRTREIESKQSKLK